MRSALLSAALIIGLAGCSSLLGLDDEAGAGASSASSSSGAGETSSSNGGASSGEAASSGAPSSSSSGGASSGSASESSSSGEAPAPSSSSGGGSSGALAQPVAGALELVVEKLAGGLRVAVSPQYLYWLERGVPATAPESDHVFARLAIGTSCPPEVNCGTAVGDTFEQPWFRGDSPSRLYPRAGDGACLMVSRQLHCIADLAQMSFEVAEPVPRGRLARLVDGFAYVLNDTAPPNPTAKIQAISVKTNDLYREKLTRSARRISDVDVLGEALVWSEPSADGTSSSVFQRTAGGTTYQLGLAHPGEASLTIDATHAYVAFTGGHVVRTSRVAPFTEEILAMGSTPFMPTRHGEFLFWLNSGSSSIVAMRADGQGSVVPLDTEPFLQDFAVDDTYVYAVTLTDAAGTATSGSVKRLRYLP